MREDEDQAAVDRAETGAAAQKGRATLSNIRRIQRLAGQRVDLVVLVLSRCEQPGVAERLVDLPFYVEASQRVDLELFGWFEMEGDGCFRAGCDETGFTDPVLQYSHAEGCSVTGGYVYWTMWSWETLIDGVHESGTHEYPDEDILGRVRERLRHADTNFGRYLEQV